MASTSSTSVLSSADRAAILTARPVITRRDAFYAWAVCPRCFGAAALDRGFGSVVPCYLCQGRGTVVLDERTLVPVHAEVREFFAAPY